MHLMLRRDSPWMHLKVVSRFRGAEIKRKITMRLNCIDRFRELAWSTDGETQRLRAAGNQTFTGTVLQHLYNITMQGNLR